MELTTKTLIKIMPRNTEEINRLAKAFNNVTAKEIKECLEWLDENGKWKKKTMMTQEVIDGIYEMRENGYTYQQIAEETECTLSTIAYILREKSGKLPKISKYDHDYYAPKILEMREQGRHVDDIMKDLKVPRHYIYEIVRKLEKTEKWKRRTKK